MTFAVSALTVLCLAYVAGVLVFGVLGWALCRMAARADRDAQSRERIGL